jgi:hypothetical protein
MRIVDIDAAEREVLAKAQEVGPRTVRWPFPAEPVRRALMAARTGIGHFEPNSTRNRSHYRGTGRGDMSMKKYRQRARCRAWLLECFLVRVRLPKH